MDGYRDDGNNNNCNNKDDYSLSTHFSVYDMHKNVCTQDYGGQCFIKLQMFMMLLTMMMMMDEWQQAHSSMKECEVSLLCVLGSGGHIKVDVRSSDYHYG